MSFFTYMYSNSLYILAPVFKIRK